MSDATERRESFLYKLGLHIVKSSKVIVGLAIIVTLLAVFVGGSALEKFSLARFQASGSESVRAAEILDKEFGLGVPNLTVVVTAKNGDIDNPEVAAAGRELAARLVGEQGVAEVASYWTRGNSPVLRSEDGSRALIIARVAGNATESRETIAGISPKFTVSDRLIESKVGGRDEVFRQVGAQAREDFVRAEMIILPAMIILLYLVYRRWLAALLTLGVGMFSVFGTLAFLAILLPFTEISTFASNLTLVMGLALGLDYSLLVISRFREQRLAGQTKEEAVATAVATAGRSVIFSGLTVGVSLSALLLFPFPFLQSFAYAGMGIVFTAIVGAVVVLPAALTLLDRRVLRPGSNAAQNEASGIWHRTAVRIMRRPVLYSVLGLALVLILAAPALGLRFGLPDDRILPETASSRQAQQQIRDYFSAEEADALQVVTGHWPTDDQEMQIYARRLSEIPGVAQVDFMGGSFARGEQVAKTGTDSRRFAGQDRTWFSVIPESRRLEKDASGLVESVRSLPAPFTVYVGGSTAEVTDFREALLSRMPLVFAATLVVTFLLLTFMTRSLLLPGIATVLNTLSLSVMFGAIVWFFQEGHFAGLLDFTATGYIEPTIPILMLCVAYGLSMDYQLFMLSRIREIYDRTHDHRTAVLVGLQRTAPIILPAAVILALTFSIYLTSGVMQLKMLALGMAVTVFVDATIIRLVLLPAFMELTGKANWWLPGWVGRRFSRPGKSRY
jgi:putative drug exporter of the RND superfamily